VEKLPDPQFANVPYDLISDDKVATFLATQDIAAMLKSYIDKYNELLARSKYFRKGTFDYHNAATIARALAANGFFKAKHSVTLNAENKVEVTTEKQLAEVIASEKAAILHDEQLRRTFNEMEKRITKNEMLRDFQEFLAANEDVLALMGNLAKLKEDVWKSYFKAHEGLYNDVIAKYQAAAVRTKEIEAEAARQNTQWEAVIEIFNRRFFVPFKLEAKNKVSVMLGESLAPSLGFTFNEGDDTAEIERPDLLEVLSTGEKKALYILNVIFEVEVRRYEQVDTVFVVDDIADSFDYKNKYAIIQYLKDIAEESCFKLIILTHNFDFFRTVNSRFVRYSHCLMVQRTASGLELVPAVGIRNIFANDWKNHFFDDARKRVAAISFIRNIIEYTRGEDDADYEILTGLLHWKGDSASVTNAELDAIYRRVFSSGGTWSDGTTPVVDTIQMEAAACLTAPEGTNFENKIVLSIAIRLAAERHMVAKIADKAFVTSITTNQTARLLKRYCAIKSVKPRAIEILDRVALMTPENIHLNSFMYEPIVDMADDHLRALYKDVLALK
jgi:AAA domain